MNITDEMIARAWATFQRKLAGRHGEALPTVPEVLRDVLTEFAAALAVQPAEQCRTDGRCQYAIDHGAEGLGHCRRGQCVMPAAPQPARVPLPVALPPLPEPYTRQWIAAPHTERLLFTEAQMTTYARAALAAAGVTVKE